MIRPGPPTPPNLQLRIRGALLGAVIGDAFGAPFGGTSPGAELTRAVYERDGAVRPWPCTDGGERAIRLAESIVERRGFEREHALATLASREGSSAGNGAVVRVAPLAALLHANAAVLEVAAADSARLTHAAPEAIAATVAQTLAVGALIAGASPKPAAAFLATLSAANLAATARPSLERVATLLASGASPIDAARTLGTSALALESLPFALFCFLRDPTRHDALIDAVACGGDTDSIGSLVGALLGAANGAGVFPRQWVHNLENGPRGRDAIVDLADAILEIAGSG